MTPLNRHLFITESIWISPAEHKVLFYVCCGLEDRQISIKLNRSLRTIKGQLESLRKRIGRLTKAQLSIWALMHNVFIQEDLFEILSIIKSTECNYYECFKSPFQRPITKITPRISPPATSR